MHSRAATAETLDDEDDDEDGLIPSIDHQPSTLEP